METYRIKGRLIHWFENYLYERKQIVVLNKALSLPHKVSAGVPQGSVLGPQLFIEYINDIACNLISSCIHFADDEIELLTIQTKSRKNYV